MTTDARHAIARSVSHDEIVTLTDPNAEDHLDLLCASDDHTVLAHGVDYWGVTDSGRAWRVSCVGEAVS